MAGVAEWQRGPRPNERRPWLGRYLLKETAGSLPAATGGLHQPHELAPYLESDADLLREYLGKQRGGLKVVKA